MPENVNTSVLEIESELADDSSKKTMVKVDHVSMIFNMASEQLNSIKEYVIAAAKRELRFKEFRALDDVSFEVKQGDVFGILGTNGSGKSTVLKIIAGVLEPSKGTCTVNGNIAPLIELGAGFDMELTARENIYLNGALLGYSKQFIEENFDDIVEFAEVEKFLDMPMKNYSSGMVARIAFAIATVIVPEILIVDEVLSVGDFMFQKKCEDRITKLIKEHGVTVLIVSHNNDQIERLCNKAVWIEKGHLRMAGTAQEVCQAYRVLGGHSGSGESERIVYETLKSPNSPDMSKVESIEAETRYSLAAKLAGRTFPNGGKAVVLAPGEHEMAALVASSLAGALESPLLFVQNDAVPDATEQELQRINPREVILLSGGTVNVDAVLARLASILPQIKPQVISQPDVQLLSESIYQFGKTNGLWGDTIVFTHDGCVGDLISFSPYLFKSKCPVLAKMNEGALSSAMKQSASSHSEILVLGSFTYFPDDELALLEGDTERIRFFGKDPYDANIQINQWISLRQERTLVCVVPVWNPEDSIAIGPYAASCDAEVLLEDPRNLDSVASAIQVCSKSNGRNLMFVGCRNRFSEMDKKLLAKVLG